MAPPLFTVPPVALTRLFDPGDLPGLGPAVRPGALAEATVRELVDETLHGLAAVRRTALVGDRLLALALCWHDRWDAAHAVCVANEGDQDADLVHLVLHRREPDADNCRYWIRQTGWHPAYDLLPPVVRAEGQEGLLDAGRWAPERFMARCQAADAGSRGVLERLQARELEALKALMLFGPPR